MIISKYQNNDQLLIQPLVSVLITAFNREKYIAKSIESVLQSTYTNFELIIVDDCSVDDTFKIASSFLLKDKRIKIFKNNLNLGQFGNRNKAIHLANGEYIKFLDSDDMLMPNGLKTMVNAMLAYPKAGLGVQCPKDNTIEMPCELISHESIILHYRGVNHLCYGPTGVIFKKEALYKVDLFEESYGILADTLLNIKVASVYSTVFFDRNLYFWRQHTDQVTTQQKDDVRMINERNIIMLASMSYKYLPLNKQEINKILNNFVKINTVHFFKYFFKGQLKNAFKIQNDTDLTIKKMFLAFFKH
ncbi:MAG: glycosyltransferase family 2 protein [Chitinophagaceae bacterium]|nr:glycosyltransferase family 2 protein [Chitinophagaceae bacterium]